MGNGQEVPTTRSLLPKSADGFSPYPYQVGEETPTFSDTVAQALNQE